MLTGETSAEQPGLLSSSRLLHGPRVQPYPMRTDAAAEAVYRFVGNEALTRCEELLEREVPMSTRRAKTAPRANLRAPARTARTTHLK